MNDTVSIPANLIVVPRGTSDDLLERQWRCRVWMKQHMPLAYATNRHLKARYVRMAKRQNVAYLKTS